MFHYRILFRGIIVDVGKGTDNYAFTIFLAQGWITNNARPEWRQDYSWEIF